MTDYRRITVTREMLEASRTEPSTFMRASDVTPNVGPNVSLQVAQRYAWRSKDKRLVASLDRFAERRRFAEHIRECERLGRAPYERVITLATRDMLGPWDGVLTHVAVQNGAAK